MKYTKRTFLPALALGFSACAEHPGVVAPNAQLRSDFTVSPPVALIYSNFGPGMAFDADPSHGWTINGFLGPGIGQQAIAQQFTPSADYTFSAAEVAVVSLSGPNIIRVLLQADAGGLPGGVVEEIPSAGWHPLPRSSLRPPSSPRSCEEAPRTGLRSWRELTACSPVGTGTPLAMSHVRRS